jgi:hypothetical protein
MLRIFHVSSHLGDDYIQRNQDTFVNDKSVNYEQIDLTYLRNHNNDFFYAGTGIIYTRYVSLMRVWLEYYSGQLPYSTINYGRVSWFGMAMRLNIS